MCKQAETEMIVRPEDLSCSLPESTHPQQSGKSNSKPNCTLRPNLNLSKTFTLAFDQVSIQKWSRTDRLSV